MNLKNSRGYSIIEIMIAVTISLILLAGLLQIFIGSRNLYNLESEFAVLEENSRFLNDYFSRVVRMAGYRSAPAAGSPFVAMTTLFPTATPFITGTNNTGYNNTDTLTVRYQGSGNGSGTPDGTMFDCLNNPLDSNSMAVNTFSINSSYQFQCQSINPNASPTTNTQVLISGVESFQVLYGEDTNGDNTADRYVPITFPYLNISNVVSIRVSFLLRSADPINLLAQSQTFNLLGTIYTSAADGYLRQPVTFTIVLRNLITNT